MRTPKFNTTTAGNSFHLNKYTHIKIRRISIFEGLLASCFLSGILLSLHFGKYGMIPVFMIGAADFAIVYISTFKERKLTLKKA